MNKPDNVEQLKRAALLRMLQKRNSVRREDGALQAIAPADRSAPLPLSWAQQRLWFLDQLDSAAGAAYHLPACLRLGGPLQRAALQAALDRIVARHEDLRTTFVLVDGQPVQSIADPARGFELVDEDLRACDGTTQDSVLEARIKAELGKPFALSEGPLIRGCLLRLADEEHVLFIVQHHIVSDGWSTGVLLREISTLYAAFSQGQPDPLPPLPLQYADYAAWQRAWLQGDKLREQIDFWRGHLSGAPALLELPTDRPRPATQSHAGGRVSLTLDPSLAAGLRELSRRHGTTLFMTLLGAWAVLLARSSGQDEVVIGTPVANRQRSEIETLIGFFVNTLALQVKLAHDPDVAQLLAQVKEATLSAFAHQDLPFEQVVEALQPARSLGHSPIFQVMFSMNNTPGGADLTLPGLRLETVELTHSTTHFDLMLELADSDGVIGGALEYASDLFDIATVERLAERYQVLLAAMVANEQLPVSQLTPMSGAERDLLVQSFNDTACDYPREQSIAQLFEAQAAATPDAPALMYEGATLSYDELNRHANRIAHHLLTLGVGPDGTVALCFERGVDMVVGMLAILKAGGAYVPLDPGYPTERLAHMLDDSAPMALLTNEVLLAKLPALTCAAVLFDRDAQVLAAQPDSNPAAKGEASQLAYVIYTSGSTGLPKGVMVEQRNVIQLAVNNTFAPLGAHDCVAHCANPAFDASTWEIWGALLVGARVLIIPQSVLLEPRQLCAAMIEGGVSATFLTVALLNQYADALAPLFPTLNYLLFGGEKTDLRKIKQVFREGAPRHLVHCYGPTETTTFATTLDIQELADDAVSLPIGAPIGNAKVYILDRHMHPVPLGVTGEIHIGGAGVARGYLNRDDLTAERFIADPFGGDGARMYKTGDLGRWLPDGTVEYIGRNDFQVKIRGFRIELGEIEARLLACEGVKEAIVLARDDNAGEKRLVAYLVAESGAELSATALRDALSSVLPAYMVPGAYVTLDALPLTPNGKLDRRALPSPGEDALASRGYEAPEGELEAAIAALWHELLGMPASSRVGRHDHFFELGGHSLMVVGMIEQLRRQGHTADVRMVFASPTPATLALAMQNRPAVEAFVVAPNLIPADCAAITPAMLPLVQLDQAEIDLIVDTIPGGAANVQDIYPLAPLQEGILFHYMLGGEGDAYLLRSVLSFDHRGRLDAFLDALQAVIDRHDILRSAIRWQGLPQPVQVVCRRASLPLITLTSAGTDDALAQLLAATDTRSLRLDLQRAPLLAAHVIADTVTEEWHLALLAHHSVCDHMTFEYMLEEIQARLQGRGASLPPALPYRNFIAQTRSVSPAQHEGWFREQLGDIDEPTAPFGVLDVQGDGGQVDEARLPLDAALGRKVREVARQHGVTPAVLFHVAWAQVLGMCTGRDDVVFGTVLSGRLQGSEGADRVLGMFINTLPIRISLGHADVRTVLQTSYRCLSELLVHEQASLALAQRCSGVAASQPLFTSLLNYRHSAMAEDDAEGELAWEGIRVLAGEERTNYPLSVSVDDLGQGFSLTAHCVPGIDATRMLAYLNAATEALAEALAQAVPPPASTLLSLPMAERAQLLDGFNDTACDYPREQTIAQLFEAQAAATPHAIALVGDGQEIGYGELNARANRIAHHLLTLGVGPDGTVALCFERGVDMVVGMLAILKAGGAYVPLDPGYPVERLAHMLDDSAPVALLTNEVLLAKLPALACAAVLFDRDAQVLAAQPDSNPAAKGEAGQLAYVIYTSGSTGLPKGVMVEQRNVIQLAVNNTFAPLGANDCVAHCANPAFDASTWEIWGALLVGARVLIIPQAVLLEPHQLCAAMIEGGVSATFLTVALLNQYADALAPLFPTLNYLLFGGEKTDLRKIKQVFREGAPRHLVHCYGPTETTTFATTLDIQELADDAVSLPIGAPIGNAKVYILDRHMHPVPLGVAGEIHVGGAGVARGYLNRDDLTAERFIADPFGGEGARMYKTGDLGRWLPDGTVEYIGRNDFQVKIRGFRIELGEIEARLLACEGVKEAIVLARDDNAGEKRLVAYLVAESGAELSATALRDALSSVLPAYMVPGAYVTLDALPLTPNGKLDRRALPAPGEEALASRGYEAPEGELEAAIAALWHELLGMPAISRVGRHDHFFELGGHSLMVVGMIEQLRRQGHTADVRMVFASPTPATLALAMQNRPAVEAFVVAPNLIAPDCAAITPAMLPLVTLTQQQIDTLVASVPGGAANVQDIYPLAPLQDGILFHHLLGGEGDAYLLRTVLSFDHRARLDGFLAAIQAVTDRHDSLRSAIRWQGLTQPVQVVCRRAPLPLITLTPAGADDALAQLLAATDPQALRMDLQQAPLLAAHIIGDTAGGAWHLALMAHHIICDHVTQELLLEEIEAVLQGQGALLPPPLPYRNFIARTRAVPAAAHEDYFRAQLGDIDEPTAPFGLLEVQHDDADIGQAQRALEPALALRIRREAREHGVTAAVLFHVAWAQVLALCTGRDDVVFGTVLSGRLQGSEGADRVFGLFINTLPVRIGLGGHDVREVVGQAYRSLSELLVHEQAALALAQRCSAVAPPLPLFTSLLNYRHSAGGGHAQDDAGHAFAWEGISVLPGEERSNYPLTISVDDMGEGFSLSAQCVPGIDPDRLLGYLHAAIDALAGALAQATPAPAATLAPLPAAERDMLLRSFNDSARDYPREQTIAQLFEAQAALRPDAPALMHEGVTLSYDELNRRANRLAHHLLALGVRPEQAVALCFERSVEMVVGMLAVLKAGGAYLPLDPAYPAERLTHMLGDSAPVALLTKAALLADLPAPACPVVLLDESEAALAARPDSNPPAHGRHPAELAYIMYTSGSTGLPKGVMVEQRNVIQLVVNNTFAPIGSEDCMAHCANPAFDAATWEIWGALLVGARVLIISQAVLLDPRRLCAKMMAGGVSATFLTSALFSQYADALAPLFPTLNYLLVGGDALEANKVRQVLRDGAPRHLVNGYGPTETTTFACAHDAVALPLAPAARSVPIGAPIGNAQVYILDRHLRPVPLGVAGEIYIGGAGVARGYLNRDGLTAERFIADPFSAVAGARMYKTGDLGRWLEDGTVDCMGRNDFQVKIRGYRIELGEIEARLLACEGVKAAVVLVREDEPGDKRLVAYLVAQDGCVLSATALRAALSSVMPAYMVPGAYVILDAFPLTANGKLDRRALRSPDGEALASRVYEAPEGAREIAIAAIWAELLGVERIGRHDQFFELGGHSLLAVQLLSRVREALGVEVALRTLFVQPTLAAFAASLESDTADARHPNLVPIRPQGELAPLFLIHPGEGEVGYARDLAAWLHGPRPLYALAASGFMAGETPQGTVEEMAARYIAAIRSVQPQGPYHLAGWSAGGTIAYEMANQLIGADETVAFLGLIDTVRDYRALVRENAALDEHGVAGFDPVAELLFRLGGEQAPAVSARLAQLAGAGDFDAMLALCQQEGLMPPDLDAGIVRRHLHVAHAIREAVIHYGPQPLPCSVSLFVAKDEQHADPLLGWGELAGERLALARVDGDHQSMMEAPHIGVLARALDAALAQAAGRSPIGQEQDYRPAILIQSGPAHVKPLFCVPGAGASVTAFTGLALTLDLNMPIYGLQPRGLDGIRVPHVDVPSAARAYVRAVREIAPSGPYHLLGHSFGGWVALEMARQLVASGERVGSLIVLDSRAPGQASPGRYTRVGMLLRLVELFEMSAGRSMELRAADLAGLDHEAQLSLLLRRLIGVKLMPASTNLQLIRGLVRVFETNLNTAYAPEDGYPHPVHLVNVAGEDPLAQSRRDNALAGWRRLAPQASVWQSEGNHMTLLSRPHVDALAAWLRPILKGQA